MSSRKVVALDKEEFAILGSIAFLSYAFATFEMMWISGFGAGILLSIFLFEPPKISYNEKKNAGTEGDATE